MPVINIKNLNKKFGANEVLRDINLTVEKGEVVAIIGPSGSGKSTLLRCMNLLDVPSKGKVIFEDNELTQHNVHLDNLRQKMGMVFQNFNLFPHKKVIENVMLAPLLLHKDSKDQLKKWGLKTKQIHILINCLEVKNKELLLQELWQWNLMLCYLMNQHLHLILK